MGPLGGCGYIFYTLLHTLNRKSSIKPLPSFYGGFEQLEEGAGGGGKQLEGGQRKAIFISIMRGKFEKRWSFSSIIFHKLAKCPAKPLAFKVSCGWCNK